MKVFVTGAAGFIGSTVVQDLIAHGHTVLGLARSDANATAIEKIGGEVLRGDIKDLEALKKGAASTDGTIHLAFIHDFQDFEGGCAADRAAIQAMTDAIEGTGKPLIIAQGTLGLQRGQINDEDTEPVRDGHFSSRSKSEDLIKQASKEKGIRGISIRLSPTVHDIGDKGFMHFFISTGKEKEFVTVPGDGKSQWSAVHRKDAAVLYRLALEKGTAGATYHAAAENVPAGDFLAVIAKKLGLPVKNLPVEEASKEVGFFAGALATDVPCTSEKTRKDLGWQPKEIGLLEDLEKNYF